MLSNLLENCLKQNFFQWNIYSLHPCGTISWYNPSVRCFNSVNQDPQKYCLLTEQFFFCICTCVYVCVSMCVHVSMCVSLCVYVYTYTHKYKRFFLPIMYFLFIHLYNTYISLNDIYDIYPIKYSIWKIYIKRGLYYL